MLYLKQAIDTACLLENQKAVNRNKECLMSALKELQMDTHEVQKINK